ncbi:hypothetical protein ONE63_008120 [Megalurothrips usitatus]|uniref:Uncharacterized protein n=1 Tax=Megalurothrips usitatus TaxID=439358 RepID=A0AAV7XNS4_9NEOP|nr:hypothetical protein ONE63_008120 [Megalurothrips usitatus]
MDGETRWPPVSRPATPLVKVQAPVDPKWKVFKIQVMKFFDTFVKARAAVPKFIADSIYESEGPAPKRRRIKPSRLLDTSSDEEIPVRKVKTAIPAPPPVAKRVPAAKKGQAGPSKEEIKKMDREEIMERLRAARAAAAAKMRTPTQRSPWKVTSMNNGVSAEKDPDAGFVDVSPFLEVQVQTGSEMNDTLPATPSSNRGKSPTVKSYADLPRHDAFYLSPSSAAAVSASLSADKDAPPQETGPYFDFLDWDNDSPKRSTPLKGPAKSVPKSQVDGRRRLSPVREKTIEERLESIESSVLSLEVLGRESSAKADLILMNVGRVIRSLLPSEKRLCKPGGMPKLPLENREQLNKFEAFLGKSDTNLSAVCDYLSSFIRTSVPDPERKSAQAILSHLLYNNLAKEMNLEGGNKKIGFRNHVRKSSHCVDDHDNQNATCVADDTILDENVHNCVHSDIGSSVPANICVSFSDTLREHADMYVAKLYAKPGVPRNLVQSVIDDITELLSSCVQSQFKTEIMQVLSDCHASPEQLQLVNSLFECLKEPFSYISTKYKRLKYFQERGALLMPETFKVSGCDSDVVVSIPLIDVLKNFLELPGVYDTISTYNASLKADDGQVENFMQCPLWEKKRAGYSNTDIVLPINVYNDGFQCNNPIGPHCKSLDGV